MNAKPECHVSLPLHAPCVQGFIPATGPTSGTYTLFAGPLCTTQAANVPAGVYAFVYDARRR